MSRFTPLLRGGALLALLAFSPEILSAALPAEPVRLDTLAAFQPAGRNWTLAGELGGDPRHDPQLTPLPGTGILVCNPGQEKEARTNLFTAWEHGDVELELEFLLPPNSNSGVYLQGRYEVQLFDSWGKRAPTSADIGGIYARYDAARGKGREVFDGQAPRANAARAPGLWQKLQVAFEAPRFDAAGKKTRNARFTRVVLNGFVVQENVEVTGPTRAAGFADEQPLGPLMLQGDHRAVAFRNFAVKRFDGSRIAVDQLRYKLYSGDFKLIGAYDDEQPKAEGVPERFAHGAIEKSGKFALVFTGRMRVPRDGQYRFAIESGSMARLQIDGRTVAAPLDRGSQPGIVTLTAGQHDFRLDLVHTTNSRPGLELMAEGPGMAPQAVTVRERPVRTAAAGKELPVEPTDRILLQRGFVPFEPYKRLYAASVGTPAGVHYAYDFETGAVLRAWRGSFIDAADMWEGRGHDQTADPTGPALTFNGLPGIALIEYALRGDWPRQPEALWSSQGYVLEPDGQPVFLSRLAELTFRDRIAPAAEGKGLVRKLECDGRLPSWSAWVLLAEASTITPQPGNRGWVIGDREWYLDWPADAPQQPVVRSVGDRQQLAVPLTSSTLGKPIQYSIVW